MLNLISENNSGLIDQFINKNSSTARPDAPVGPIDPLSNTSNTNTEGRRITEEQLSHVMRSGVLRDAANEAMHMVKTNEGEKLSKTVNKKGVTRSKMMREYKVMKKNMKQEEAPPPSLPRTIIIVSENRQLTEKVVSLVTIKEDIKKILKCQEPIEVTAPLLSEGHLSGKDIKIWYDSNNKGRNRKLSKLAGIRCGGAGIIVCYTDDLTSDGIKFIEDNYL